MHLFKLHPGSFSLGLEPPKAALAAHYHITIALKQWFSTRVLTSGTPCSAPTHLIQMNGSLSSYAEAC